MQEQDWPFDLKEEDGGVRGPICKKKGILPVCGLHSTFFFTELERRFSSPARRLGAKITALKGINQQVSPIIRPKKPIQCFYI